MWLNLSQVLFGNEPFSQNRIRYQFDLLQIYLSKRLNWTYVRVGLPTILNTQLVTLIHQERLYFCFIFKACEAELNRIIELKQLVNQSDFIASFRLYIVDCAMIAHRKLHKAEYAIMSLFDLLRSQYRCARNFIDKNPIV